MPSQVVAKSLSISLKVEGKCAIRLSLLQYMRFWSIVEVVVAV